MCKQKTGLLIYKSYFFKFSEKLVEKNKSYKVFSCENRSYFSKRKYFKRDV